MNRELLEEGIFLEDNGASTVDVKLSKNEDLLEIGTLVFTKRESARIRGFIDMWFELDD